MEDPNPSQSNKESISFNGDESEMDLDCQGSLSNETEGQSGTNEEDAEDEMLETEDEGNNNDKDMESQAEDRDANVENANEQDIDVGAITPSQFKELRFHSAECAYSFYNEYGRMNGFGIRRSKVGRNKRKELIWVRFVCNRAGYRDRKHLEKVDRKRKHRALSRCGCPAELRVRVDVSTGLWYVSELCDNHNHQLVGDKQRGLARSHQKMTDADIGQLYSMRKSGISTPQIFAYFAGLSGGIPDVGFRKRKVYNQIVKERAMFDCDFKEALKYLAESQSVDPAMYWKHSLADDGSFLYLFWCDGCSQLDYEIFGDVLAFDATYGKNKYKLPLIIFSGVNHHKQTVVFASAIVANETEQTYVWVLQQFLEAMKGKCPRTVITDGDLAIRNAIMTLFPEAHHRLCAWHLLRNATSNLGKPYFTREFKKCMLYDLEVHEFEERWRKLIEECGLQENQWVAELYSKKTMWASAHIRGKFFAGLRTTSRCEGLHAIIGNYVKKGYNFVEFLEQYDRCIENLRNNEIEADYKSQNTDPVLETEFPQLENFASEVYTRDVFDVFRSILVNSATIRILEVVESPSARNHVTVKYCTPNFRWHVSYYPQLDQFKCSCRRFESSGIPCVHILKVIIDMDMEELPPCLIMERWTKGVKESLFDRYGLSGARVDAKLNIMRYGSLVHSCREMCKLACYNNDDVAEIRNMIEQQKARLKAKHGDRVEFNEGSSSAPIFRSGQSSQNVLIRRNRKPQCCSICHNEGHNRTTCPTLFSQTANVTSNAPGASNLTVDDPDENTESVEL